ncbi:S1/P1 nuclease [Russula earlei]|uniref:S1/P1 nuclease n=1 Tax=Russula earlei TaxID=71964 RepID=A0ACC0U574_9AGAM|nr:S1/P1 nuclease [Russula earlei]
MASIKKLFFIAVLFYLPLHSFAWGMLGHRIVGEVADSYLTPKARLAIKQILGNESMAMASNWPDFIKSDPTYNYLSPWHYADLEDGLSYEQLQDYFKTDTIADAYTKLTFLIKELKNKQLPKDKQLLYLRLVIHIIGDIHQPMHVGHTGDLGGNKISVMWFRDSSNLHRVWDDQLIDYQQLSYTEYTKAINFTTPAQRSEWQQQPMSQWFYESYQVSRELYREIKQPYQKLSYSYNFKHIAELNERLLKGGVRLAGVLNGIFG